ncbi:MAG: hypothetical protein RMJ33_02585 [Saprospiraceae bacterium]|nr:hypothetical protein [Saprospiraceae bacterium]MDW8228703.1 hypothetical protein [Saprospiraceae bacterium]
MRFLFLLVFLLPNVLWAQSPDTVRVDTQYVSVLLTGGKRYVGWIVSSDSASITLSTTSGVEVSLARASIKQMRTVSREYFRRRQRGPADATTRETYFINPSAYAPSPGEGYLITNYALFYQANYGITENLSIRLGGLVTPLFVAPKLTVPVVPNRLILGMEGIVGGLLPLIFDLKEAGSERTPGFSFMRGMATVGNRATHLTASVGLASGGQRWAPSPVYGLAASWRISPTFGLMTENYLYLDESLAQMHMLGGRFYTRTFSFDIGAAVLDDFPLFWYGVAFHFY